MEYTKGEWRIDTTIGCWIVNDKGQAIAAVCASLSVPEYKANAHLIAAAPDMYEALKEMNDGNFLDPDLEAFKALTKAEGR